MKNNIRYTFNDGGREASGFKGATGDCVTRAIAIVTGKPYSEIYDRLAIETGSQRKSARTGKRSSSARNGINTTREWFKRYMTELGLNWVATMHIGSGCKVHLLAEELPYGSIICSLSKHYCAVVDGVIHDTYDPSRNGTRCVYGYWHI
tara:strand:+ start:3124 stop:3570 length:447 start_codon:yes stop_codon:yes gene_type:complete